MDVFTAHDLQVSLGGNRVLGPLDLHIASGSFLGILGPNGSGKTTLLRVLAGTLRPTAGESRLDGRLLKDYRTTELARLVGVVPQQFTLDFSFTVREMVGMGRYAHTHRGMRRQRPAVADHEAEAVETALIETGLTELADRMVTSLSGGERQRALIAQTLAQGTPTLLLDEPLNNLDLNHQLEIMQLLARLHREGRTIAVVLHDLNMAAQYCDELLLLNHGLTAARGTPSDVLDPRIVLDVYRVRVAVHSQGQRPYVTPLWTKARGELCEEALAGVHVIAGGGAASPLIEELVLHGLAPSIGIVSVFDSDYATAQRYELEVVSAPPFQPFPSDALQSLADQIRAANMVVVAPLFFGPGNLESLNMALEAQQAGKTVILMDDPPIAERDLTEGHAARLTENLRAAGAIRVETVSEVIAALSRLPS